MLRDGAIAARGGQSSSVSQWGWSCFVLVAGFLLPEARQIQRCRGAVQGDPYPCSREGVWLCGWFVQQKPLGLGRDFLALSLDLSGSGVAQTEGWDAFQGPCFGQPLRCCHSSVLCCNTSSLRSLNPVFTGLRIVNGAAMLKHS